jgi:two-component system sensor histidine kinase KdpD
VRRAWRSAQRLGTDLDLLWVKPPGTSIEGDCERQVTALRRLASVLGATFLIEENDDVVAGAARVVRERGSTYVMVGESGPAHGLARLREPLPQRLMHAAPPGVDVRIVAHRGQPSDLCRPEGDKRKGARS